MRTISVVDYDPQWPTVFEQLRAGVGEVLGSLAIAVEHIGSTAVPGLSAKPVIDMSVVVSCGADVPTAIEQLATLGYDHLGNLGIEGREAFDSPTGLPDHNLYVCEQGSLGLRNHLAVRDHLRCNPDVAMSYGELKKTLACRYPNDIDSYIDGKTDFLLGILAKGDLTDKELQSIAKANRKE